MSKNDQSGQPPEKIRTLRSGGCYRKLLSFQSATLIYDATADFCGRWVDKRSRTHDQMIQAARSGRQNIAEGSRASIASSQTELLLVNVARASLDELLLDYEDLLRQRGLRQWKKDDPEAKTVRGLALQKKEHASDQSDPTDRSDKHPPEEQRGRFAPYDAWLTHDDPAVVANTIICLIHQTNYLLDRQIAGREREFIQHGGYTERLATARIMEREKHQGAKASPPPRCPLCRKEMIPRTAHKGPHAGSQFWGCPAYPVCRGTRPFEGE